MQKILKFYIRLQKKWLNVLVKFLIRCYSLFDGCSACQSKIPELASRIDLLGDPEFPVDVVYTWVDGADPAHALKKIRFSYTQKDVAPDGLEGARFRDNEELRYSLRSVFEYAPWINRVFIVSDGQIPKWLDVHHPKIRIVDHRHIVPHEFLPTFNSHVIECYLHKIPDLAEHYLYFNDDFFITAPVTKKDFFTPNGIPFIFTDWRVRRIQGYYKAKTPHARSFFNTLKFLRKKGLVTNTSLVTAHIPYSQTKTLASDTFNYFEERIHSFSPNKFRTVKEIAFYCHALPLLAYARLQAIAVDEPYYYINTKRFDRNRYYEIMLKEKNSGTLPKFICLNDAGDVEGIHTWREDMQNFLENYYPEAAPIEITG